MTATEIPTLTDGVVTLRRLSTADRDGIVAQCTAPTSVEWTTVPQPYTADDAVQWVTRITPQNWENGTELVFAIEAEHPDGGRRFAGSTSLRPHGEGVAEIAFGLHPAVFGRGVCSRAVKLLLAWAFTERDIEVVTWYAFVGNWASRRVAWANGFTFHGTVVDLLPHRGRRRDSWFASLRATDSREPKENWLVPPVLHTDRLRLRPFADSDAARLAEVILDEDSRYYSGQAGTARGLTAEFAISRVRETNAVGQALDWCIADRETDRLLGWLMLFDLIGLDETAVKCGYVVHPDARGRGVLTEALRATADWALRPVTAGGFGKRRISLRTAAVNTASWRAAERAGFTHVATEPGAFPLGEDGFDDLKIYAMANPDRPR